MLARDRRREGARGLGLCSIRELYPVAAAAFTDLGWLDTDGTDINPQMSMTEYKDEAGDLSNVLPGETSHKFTTHLAQVSQAEVDLIKNAAGMDHAIRYYGMINPWIFQYACAELAKIVPNIPRTWKPGKQNIPLTAYFLKQDNSIMNIPEYYFIEAYGKMLLDNLAFWASPRRGWNANTNYLLDASGFAMHGTAATNGEGTAASIWSVDLTNYPLLEAFLDCDENGGALAYVNHGPTFAPGANNILIEGWIKNPSIGTASIIMSKCTTPSTGQGFCLSLSAAGYLTVYLYDGMNTVAFSDNTHIIGNNWTHIGFEIDQIDDWETLFMNGVPIYQPAHTINSISNAAANLLIGACGTNYSHLLIGDMRIHTSPAATSLNSAAIVAANYAAELSIY